MNGTKEDKVDIYRRHKICIVMVCVTFSCCTPRWCPCTVYRGNLRMIGASEDGVIHVMQENSIATDYVTEKLYDAFVAGCVPLYYGAPNIEDLLPDPDSIIDYRHSTLFHTCIHAYMVKGHGVFPDKWLLAGYWGRQQLFVERS